MTKFQACLIGFGILLVGAGLAIAGILVKNDTLLGLGLGLVGSGITSLGLPRPQDV